MEGKAPEEYFCPKCNEKMMKDMVVTMQSKLAEDTGMPMPTLQVVIMGLNIIGVAGCPSELMQPIWNWTKTYGKDQDGLNLEEQDKLKLIKWNEWVKSK